jgi:HSP20 family protein
MNMNNVSVQKIRDRNQGGALLQETSELLDRVRTRAFELSQWRGGAPGNDLADWLQAEREIFEVPAADLTENDGEFRIQLALPGFDAKDIRLAALPDSLIVEAENTHEHRSNTGTVHYCEFGEHRVFRQIPLPKPVDVEHVSATLDKGVLEVHAVKARDQGKRAAA